MLLKKLIRAALAEPGSVAADRTFAGAADRDWLRVETDLEHHRIAPLMATALVRGMLGDAVPAGLAERLREIHAKTSLTNNVLMLTTARVLAALRERGVEPIAWKGIVLADSCYPEPGARWMGDVDFSIEGEQVQATREAFTSVGMRAPEALQTEDALYFENKMGVMFDVHHRVRLFEGRDESTLYRDITPRHMPSGSLRILEPSAMLVHLSVHMDGHLDEMGHLLSWLLDVAFFVRRWGDELDAQRMRDLMPADAHWASLLRTVRFLQVEFDVPPPTCLAKLVEGLDTFTLDTILRDRRRVPWGLPNPRGLARIVKHRLVGSAGHELPMPTLGDLLRWPGDALRAKRLLKKTVPSGR